MKPAFTFLFKVVLMVLIWTLLWRAFTANLSEIANLSVIFAGPLLVVPIVLLGRRQLARRHHANSAAWTTTFVHAALMLPFGVPMVRALATHPSWMGWQLPMPPQFGLALVVVTGLAFIVVVLNLALRGLGAPFFIALSRRLAADWLYAWTRNPMVLAGVALLVSLGIWFRSALFVAWAVAVFTPALLFFVKLYEEQELEIRFGTPYLEYKRRTPMLFPRRPVVRPQSR